MSTFIKLSEDIDSLTIERGESLTVWLNKGTCAERDAVECFLSVDRSGRPKLKVSHSSCEIIDLD